ncbi:hypothetical protein K450DRAFT_271257 [Umbelopsis ramanniana AG]|uniref:Glycine-rich protein n=1 Tax=Umbelopsis ramanniana AG TaxID=1314678 RepID=A0AAD5EAY9_UMBRA|nr:uncharacterized protein K450DRAFT_271257 [Umbelopsis ramanniana AG]KAI8580149.1 hypothetical protein K450DRAFT_271257 [Umbelopsis ramanniana AG]
MQRFPIFLFLTLLVLVFAVSARSRDDDDDDDEDNYYPSAPYGGYGPNGQGGWVDEYGHWHSGASTQTIVKGALAVPAAIAIGFMAL